MNLAMPIRSLSTMSKQATPNGDCSIVGHGWECVRTDGTAALSGCTIAWSAPASCWAHWKRHAAAVLGKRKWTNPSD